MKKAAFARDLIELVDVVGAGGIEIDFLKERDVDRFGLDHARDFVQRMIEMGCGTGPVAAPEPIGARAVSETKIPSEDPESHGMKSMMKIITVDCNYVEPGFAASYLLVRGERAMFVECNTNHALPELVKAVHAEGLSLEQVDGLIVTHIHLDHAGGAGLFLKTFPNARLFAHPKAARHAIDPSKLVASATAVYGEEFMQRLYGTILPCPEERVQVLKDGDSLFFQGVELEIRHTRGHANHHLVVFEPLTRTLFTGDSCGVSYPVLNAKHGVVALVSTSPTDFDGEAALATLDWIERLAPAWIAPTHFGMIPKSEHPRMLAMLRDQLRFSMDLLTRIRNEGLSEARTCGLLRAWVSEYFQSQGFRLDERELGLLDLDLRVNAQGLMYRANLPS